MCCFMFTFGNCSLYIRMRQYHYTHDTNVITHMILIYTYTQETNLLTHMKPIYLVASSPLAEEGGGDFFRLLGSKIFGTKGGDQSSRFNILRWRVVFT